MSDQDITDPLDRWSKEFEERMRKAGRPFRKKHETSRSYRAGCKKESAFLAKEKLK